MLRVTNHLSMRLGTLIIMGWLLILSPVHAQSKQSPAIKAVDVSTLSGNKTQVRLTFSEPFSDKPRSFEIAKPAKVVLDFPGVENGLTKEQSNRVLNLGVLQKVNIVQGDDRVRVVLDLNQSVPYDIDVQGRVVFVTFMSEAITEASKSSVFVSDNDSHVGTLSIRDIDFRRGPDDSGRVMIDLSSDDVTIDMKEEGSRVLLKFVNTDLPNKFARKLDVTDFATPIQMVSTHQEGRDVVMEITTAGLVESMAYQADNRFTLEVRKLTRDQKEALERENQQYSGERLSLNFQDIEVRAVLQLLADFTGLNIVTSDTVSGNLTLRLRNVPWDQALAIILKTKGLDKRQIGNVMLIGPSEEIAAREKLELENSKQVEELAPLRSEYIQVNYAKASEIANLIKNEANTLLSERGSASVDDRTNTLLVQDTASKIDQIRDLVHRLDIPIRQVLIESRVVFASDNFEDALGIRFGGAMKFRPGNEPVLGVTGRNAGGAAANIALGGTPSATSIIDRLGVQLPVTLTSGAAPATLGLSIARLPGGTILDLELQALEAEGLGKIIASPRLMTSNQQPAYIESGEEIPYQEATSSGAASVAFKKAVLRLEVTPQITPDDNVFLDLTVNQDSRGSTTFVGGPPAINTREIHTKVLVANGDTVVLGGIYEQTKNSGVTRVPFLGRLPMVGWLFRSETNLDNRSELMIFVTPKIVKEGMG